MNRPLTGCGDSRIRSAWAKALTGAQACRRLPHILIIGGGVAGYPAAIRASRMGAEVTLIERDALGGTCLNWGCIPTKALLQSAGVVRTLKSADHLRHTLPRIRC